MTQLVDILDSIRGTQAEIARADAALAGGRSRGVELSIKSLRFRLERLEEEFADATSRQEIDVCSYRLIPDGGATYPVAALGRAMTTFQELLSVLYDSVKSGQPKARAKMSPESRHESTLDFGYAFAGSLGFVFTVANERLLIGDSLLDMAMGHIVELSKTPNADAVAQFARKFGAAPIRLAHEWATAHVGASLSLDLEWRRKTDVRIRMTAQVAELRDLADLIASTSASDVENAELFGKLVGIDVVSRSFHLVLDEKTDVRGSLHADFKMPATVSVPSYYTAVIESHRKLHYATGLEERTNILRSLKRSSESGQG